MGLRAWNLERRLNPNPKVLRIQAERREANPGGCGVNLNKGVHGFRKTWKKTVGPSTEPSREGPRKEGLCHTGL